MRLAHYLKPTARSERVQAAIWFDTETHPADPGANPITHVLTFGWACYQARWRTDRWTEPEWYYYTNARDFWEWVGSKAYPGRALYLFCHNTNFDLPVLDAFNIPMTMGWEMTRAVIDGPPTILHMRRGKSTLKVLDTLNFWRVPLAELGESIGSPKLTMPADGAPQSDWDIYCKADVEVIRRACHEWWDFLYTNDLGGFAPTLAGQAFRTFRHRFMEADILIDCDDNALDLARRAYLGGRNECFRHGRIEGPIYYLDINSMYPSVMRGNKFPTRLLGFDNLRPQSTYEKYRRSHATIAEVFVSTDEAIYPKVVEGRLCFPVGQFWTVLAGPELEIAYGRGHIQRWKSVAVYHQEEIFTGFVDFFYGERTKAKKQHNTVKAFFLKILMNSLYGKFGQRGMVWEETCRAQDQSASAWIEYDVDTGRLIHHRKFGGLYQVKSEEGEARESMPAIAAYVTSYARVALYRLLMCVGMDNAIYCDTDGLFTLEPGYQRVRAMLSDIQLGAPKLEQTAPFVTIRGLKDYTLGESIKVKGVRKKAHWLSNSEVRQEQWSGLKGMLRTNTLNAPTTRLRLKRLSRRYRKGSFQYTGRVAPIRLRESAA